LAKKLLLGTKHLLGIYTNYEPGNFVVVVQPFWLIFSYEDRLLLINDSPIYFEKSLKPGRSYLITIYRYAADYVHKIALSKELNKFTPR
jgi:hypothetical protein